MLGQRLVAVGLAGSGWQRSPGRAERSEGWGLGTGKEGLGSSIDFLDFDWDFLGSPYYCIIDLLGFLYQDFDQDFDSISIRLEFDSWSS